MSDELMRSVAADLNFTQGAAERAPRMATLAKDNNKLIADTPLPFDSTPYAFVHWLAETDRR